ncbi:MAG: NAD(P)/FAD-dependent oxidoreductase [Longimicrobiales bacterium]
MSEPDVLVIGGGIVGAATAYALASDGFVVEVLEAGCIAGGATAAGMGHIVAMDDSEAQFALTTYSRRLLAEVAEGLPPSCELDVCGTLWIAEDEAQLDAVHGKAEWYRARGVATEVLDGRALAEAEPNLRAPLAGALRVPDDAVVYPPALAAWFLERAKALGARVRTGEAVESVAAHAVTVGGTQRTAEHVVLAAGAAATRLVPPLPIVPRKGHLVITDRYPGFCRHQLVELGYLASAHTMTAASVAFNVQPRRTGQLLIGSSRELVGWDAAIHRDVVRRMLARAMAFVPALGALTTIRTWTGFRPATSDKLPLIGEWEDVPGLWIAAGHEGLGITTAIGTAMLLADLMRGRQPAIDPAPYSPARTLAHAEA